MFVEKQGMQYFFEKNFPTMTRPSRSTVSRGALYDVYNAVLDKIKEDACLLEGSAVCAMFDAWSDKYRRLPYIGLRLSYVDSDWKYRIVTVSVKVVEKHTAENMACHVRQELAIIGISLHNVQLFTTHDGAANMVKTSRLLRSDHYQHCIAHSLHLLLVTDGINRIPELAELIDRCKNVVTKLDAKCYVVDHESAKLKDRQVMDFLIERISAANQLLRADGDISLYISGRDNEDDDYEAESDEETNRRG